MMIRVTVRDVRCKMYMYIRFCTCNQSVLGQKKLDPDSSMYSSILFPKPLFRNSSVKLLLEVHNYSAVAFEDDVNDIIHV